MRCVFALNDGIMLDLLADVNQLYYCDLLNDNTILLNAFMNDEIGRIML